MRYIQIRKSFVPRGERGATAAEYALMISGIALVLVLAIALLGQRLANAIVLIEQTLF